VRSVALTAGTLIMFCVTWFVVPLLLRERPGIEDR
jgi:hypothetical protein